MPQNTDHLDDDCIAACCKALAHPARIAILRQLLAEGRCICGRIVEVMPLAQSTVSQHLKILKQAGLVTGHIDGPKTCYCVDMDMLARFSHSIEPLLAPTAQEKCCE